LWWKKISTKWKIGDILRTDEGQEEFEILAKPIKGGMGVIYICKALQYNRFLAFKGLNKEVIDTPEAEAKFQREAEIWLDLGKHPNIVPLRFACTINHQKFLVMDAILPRSEHGNTLASWMNAEKKLDIENVINFSIQICHGMIHASKEYEKKGYVFIHGDLHPGNILIDERSENTEVLKVTDFGLVKDQKSWSQKYMGTLKYTPCERWNKNQEIDQRADVYSFGCLVNLMLTGHPPFEFPENLPPKKKRALYHKAHCEDKREPPFRSGINEDSVEKLLNNFVFKCLERNPNNRYSNFSKCLVVLEILYEKYFDNHVEIDENDLKINAVDYYYRGVSYFGINHLKEAEEAWRKALEIDPKDANTWNSLGNLLALQERSIEAEGAFRNALEINSKHVNAWNNLGIFLTNQKRFEEAKDAFRKVLEIDPKYKIAWNNLGVLLNKQDRSKEAEDAYRKALELNPKDAKVWNNLGLLLNKQDRFKEAENSYRKALKIDPKYPGAWNNLGIVLVNQDRYEGAEKIYLDLLKFSVDKEMTYYNLACLYGLQQKLSESIKYLKQAIDFDPKYKEMAKTDTDFDLIRDTPEFRELLN